MNATRPTVLLVLFAMLGGYGAELRAQELGRLFLRPAERAYLERLRLIDAQLVPIVLDQEEAELEEPDTPAPEPVDVVYRHGGTMRRSDGSYTVWLNNLPVAQDALPDNVELLLPYSRGELRISDPDSRRSYRVKPGQVLNLTQGVLQESYQAPDTGDGAADSGEAESESSPGDPQ